MIIRLSAALLMLALGACASLPESKNRQAGAFAGSLQDTGNACHAETGCGLDSPLRDLADATASAAGDGKHQVILLDQGNDALLTRLHMIESARHSIELQVFIYDLDESGTLMLDAMVRA
ncbi:MAG: phospholipase D family protein, partial [Arenimonas sp.]